MRRGNCRAAPRRWVGGRDEISAQLSQLQRAWCRSTIPRSTRPPPRRPGEGGIRRTTRPARELCLTGRLPRGGEPADLRMATGPGTNEYRDRPGRRPRHSRPAPWSGPPESACALGAARPGPEGPEPRQQPITSRVAAELPSPRPLSTPDRGEKRLIVPGKGKYCHLTLRACCEKPPSFRQRPGVRG